MVAITSRDLHMKTGACVRKAALHDGIVVMDRKLPVARIIPYKEAEAGCSFADRELVKEFGGMHRLKVDSSHLISEDRDRG
jgi:antitoxin (DNA-binding transcriptional repressor) of toxin-antitoxin stability system